MAAQSSSVSFIADDAPALGAQRRWLPSVARLQLESNEMSAILRLKKEGPGLVRGVKARGRGVETEAGPEETLCCSASVERRGRQQAQPAQLLVGEHHLLAAVVLLHLTEAGQPR